MLSTIVAIWLDESFLPDIHLDNMVYLVPKYFQEHGVARKLQTRSLLIAINLVAGLSIFFFGYDQGKAPSDEC